VNPAVWATITAASAVTSKNRTPMPAEQEQSEAEHPRYRAERHQRVKSPENFDAVPSGATKV
jgi:hypothetical protein